ncbi:MAG: hypothetical protein JNJ50_24235 [Acidobacteria bacterium]|nr:hypothetical protein [Acidobacteriota bacterium]
MQIANHAQLTPAQLATLQQEMPPFGTLHEFVLWGQRQHPPVFLGETIAQDEYTHDVLARWRDGLWLVFGAT